MSVTKDPDLLGDASVIAHGLTEGDMRRIAAMLNEQNVPQDGRILMGNSDTFRFFDPDDIPTDGQYWVDLSA